MRTSLDGHPVLADDVFDGFTLLEADAGTGKTWTLANLVLRALIERDASIDEIVVVTFTRKAAAELRERILRAVESLESALAGEDVSDPFIAAYLPRCEPERDLHRLRRARALFEEAPISTIHGLCQRILAEQSLSIAQPADAELRDIKRAQVEAGVQRWWRQVLVEEDAWTVGVLLAAGNSAERLARGLRRLLTDDTREIAPAPVDRSRYVAELRRLAAAAREALAAERDDYAEWLRVTKGVNRGSYSRANVPKWFDQLAEWLDALPGSLSARPRGRDAKLPRERFAASAFAGVTDAPPPFALARLLDEIDALVVGRAGLRAGLLAELRERLAREMAARKREERIQTYDDLLLLTRDALRDESQGEALAQRLRRRYPIVFVDECQDTDPCQWEILRRLHEPTFRGEGDPSLSLVLVGDPKQSIYSFRNADIFAYLGARADARRRFRLARNQRACDELVVGLNELFASPGVFALDEIAFAPALPGTRPRARWLPPPGDDRRALNLVEIDGVSGVPARLGAALAAMASEIAALLAGARGEIVAPDGTSRRPSARDIAVLVRKAEEGELAKRALREQGIGAVEISRQSVFATRDAAELLRIVDAVADPASVSAMRGALLTAPLGYDAPALERAMLRPAEWSRLVEHFARAASAWRHVGPVAALRRLLFHDFDAAARLAADRDAERRLTNLMHLLELLGAMPEAREEAMLARGALAERIARAEEGGDETAELRLESDADLVQILTMHKSKGLEFPVVFVPFGWREAGAPRREQELEMHAPRDDGSWRTVLVCGPRHDAEPAELVAMRGRAEVEALSEAMRLMYVAVTRAELRLYLFWVAEPECGAVGRLLGNAPRDRVARMAGAHPRAIAAFDCEALRASAGGAPRRPPTPALDARRFRAEVPPPWDERSYTGLMRAIRPATTGWSAATMIVDAPRPDHDEWIPAGEDTGTDAPDARAPGETSIRHTFPAGARAGTALHAVLETVDLARPVEPARVAEVLWRHGIESDAGAVAAWLDDALETPLSHGTGAVPGLRTLRPTAFMRELKFTLPAVAAGAPDRTGRIVDIVRREFRIDGRLIAGSDWHGYLGGFIDLVFEAEGRYWLLDWKSNRLGMDDGAYRPESMAESIATHGYALQFCLYTVALHRLLGARLADYDYDRHFGGVFYAFLRGMTGAAGGGVHFARPSRELVAALDAQLSGAAEGGRR